MTTHWRSLVLAALLLALCVPVMSIGSGTAEAAASATRTESGSGRFEDLKVTVSQTTHLRNQVIDVSWTGFKQTTELTGSFSTNYLQIMQCWEGENAPTRESCQFGGFINDSRGGFDAPSRKVSYGFNLIDPLETLTQAPGSSGAVRVPFHAVNGKSTTDVKNEFFDQYTTNEIPYARSAADGSGTEPFEIQTATQASGLGCGNPTDEGPRDCWLVVVPRDDIEVNGMHAEDTAERKLISSPLSASNWKNAISFKLEFEPVALSCPIGGAERRLLGHEEMAEAVSRWQPTLCGATGSVFGFSQLGDDQARAQLLSPSPRMSVVANPIEPDLNPDGRRFSYAPVGISAIGIAINIDRVPKYDAPEAVQQQRGTKVRNLKLNARLVAKLLTQSYNLAALSRPAAMANNPLALSDDPEFLELNPEFNDLAFMTIRQITNPLGLSDANKELWHWVGADPAAKAFLAGKADKWGMTVNPSYKGMSTDRADFPRSDNGCRPGVVEHQDLCPLDALAYAADFHDAGRGAARGDNLERTTWDLNPPVQWKKNPPQLSGERQVLALVDTATAARYKLPMVSLLNASGKYVAPTSASMTAALGGLKDSGVDGVKVIDSQNKKASAYPLTSISYAVSVPKMLTEPGAAKAYAGFLRYAAGKGQVPGIGPGQLPAGYVPLTKELRAQTLAAAKVVEARGGTDGTTTPPGTEGDGPGSGTGVPPDVGGPVAGPNLPPGTTPVPIMTNLVAGETPSAPAGGARFVLLAALLLGAAACLARPAAPLVRRLLNSGTGAP